MENDNSPEDFRILENKYSPEECNEDLDKDYVGVRYRVPTKPKCARPKQGADRETARLWRKKKFFNGLKCNDDKTSKDNPINDLPNVRNVPKNRREPLPMRKRALPESFWKEPITMQTSSLARDVSSFLPPLFTTDNNNTDMTEIRPASPPGESSSKVESRKSTRYMTSPPNTDLLFSLFDQFDSKVDQKRLVRRGRPKKQPADKDTYRHPPKREDDPHMVDALSEKLFPQLSLNSSLSPKIEKYAVIKLPTRGKTVELPAIQLEQNYTVMLDELTMHL